MYAQKKQGGIGPYWAIALLLGSLLLGQPTSGREWLVYERTLPLAARLSGEVHLLSARLDAGEMTCSLAVQARSGAPAVFFYRVDCSGRVAQQDTQPNADSNVDVRWVERVLAQARHRGMYRAPSIWSKDEKSGHGLDF